MPGAPRAIWVGLLILLALVRVLPAGPWLSGATWGSRLCAGLIALWLLPYGVDQVRLSLHPALEQPWTQAASFRLAGMAEEAVPAAAPAPASPPPAPAMAPEPNVAEMER